MPPRYIYTEWCDLEFDLGIPVYPKKVVVTSATLRISKSVTRARTTKKFAEANETRIRIRPQASISGARQTLVRYISETFILVYPRSRDGIGRVGKHQIEARRR